MSSDLKHDQYNDLRTYHTALKQFLNVSNAPSKPNPKRAAKAREKLLKLSSTQFYELSTDVYDELERRIDESRDEPDFLLPKPSFHPKRNEAREKLGSLQQGRFRDLVSDIFYEIERRNYQKIPEKLIDLDEKHEYNNNNSNNNNQDESNQDRRSDPSNKNGVVGLQSTTVIPTKADLAWSSDEEDDNVGELKKSNDTKRNTIHSIHSRNHSRNQSKELIQDFEKNSNNSNRNSYQSNLSDLNDSSTPSPQKKNINRGLSISKGRNKDREIEMLLEEGTKMDQTITQLEQKIALLQSKSDKFENESNDLKKINSNLNVKIEDLKNELISNKEIIDNHQKDINTRSLQQEQPLLNTSNGSSSINQEQLDDLKKEVIDWRSKFEDLKLQKIEDILSINKLSEINTSKHLINNGLIPINLINFLYQTIENFLLFLNKETKSSNLKININELFNYISKISNVSSKIISFAPHSEKIDLVRASISHAITSTRYYALYSEFLPKLIVESAVSEIVFTICDLISDVKLIKDDSKFDTSEFNQSIENSNSNTKSKKIEDEDPSEISPVRPLRMAKKSFENNSNNNTPSNINKTINSSTNTNTPRSLNLTINPQNANNEYKKLHPEEFSNKNTITPSPNQLKSNFNKSDGFNDSFASPSTTRSLKLNSNSNNNNTSSINGSDNKEISGNIPPSSSSSTTTPLRKSGLPSLVSRYSPESERKPQEGTTPPKPHLRKSSSSNILSKVRQFEQQGNSDSESSKTSPQRSIVSPFNDSKIGKLSPRRTSFDSQKRISVDSQNSSKQNNVSIPESLEKKDLLPNDKLDVDTKKSNEPVTNDLLKSIDLQTKEESNSKPNTNNSVLNTVKSSIPAVIPAALASVVPASLSSNKSPKKDEKDQKTQTSSLDDGNGNGNGVNEEKFEQEVDQQNDHKNGNNDVVDDDDIYEDSDDLNSVAQLRGAIAKDKQFSPQKEKKSLNPELNFKILDSNTIPQLNNLKISDDNKQDEEEELEDDLNEVPNEVSNTYEEVNEGPLNISKTRQPQSLTNTYQKFSVKEANVDPYTAGSQPKSSTNESDYNKSSAISKSLNLENDKSGFATAQTQPDDLNSNLIEQNGKNVIKPVEITKGDRLKGDDEDHEEKQDDKDAEEESYDKEEEEEEDEEEEEEEHGNVRRGRDLDEDFDVRDFDIEDPDNTLSELLLYLEHQTVKVISTIQTLLTSIKAADSTKGELRSGSRAINAVVSQMIDATSNSMNQSRNASLKEHGIWVVQSLEDSGRRMDILCNSSSKDGEESEDDNEEYAEKHFKQRLAGIAFDVAKCTKELVKTVEEANLREEIEHLDAKMNR
ncbi:Autophagy-related protein [Wickerhamomyces ciferrii]|uniref:Autophagy-related protein n=1 Tax=Wickerhamomyces ciferrii (strain ATCC 14091 / BCRC 22168 / CBS 111 / JCM 3599 / NBRC 0793 / NRRL Y-1031 F-60-10) TaxID=1206466 RepID=K0KCL0_WICCF|nr:Autophagy-related protein [Wickerhamomyces ciferrii]CCH42800.1 Autophagy-related protein [Wickerhamomyces ciferrii]